MKTEINKAIRDFFSDNLIPENITTLSLLLTTDLWSGPISEDKDYPGFVKGTKELKEWCDNNITTLYYDNDCDIIYDSYPGEENPENICELSPRYIKEILFGKELVIYL